MSSCFCVAVMYLTYAYEFNVFYHKTSSYCSISSIRSIHTYCYLLGVCMVGVCCWDSEVHIHFAPHKLLCMKYGLQFANDNLGSSEFLLTYYFTFDLVIIFYKQLCYIQALRKEIKRKPWYLLVHLTVIWLCVLFGPQWP